MGSKNRLSKDLIPIITKDLLPRQWYVEPFVGGCNMIDKINHKYRLGADSNKYLIALLKAIQNDLNLPEYITKEEYLKVKDNKDNYPDWYVGFIGFICSFRGKWFAGYAGNGLSKTGDTRNYQKQQINNIKKQAISIKGIKLECISYDALDIPANSIIYCDPPYQGTTKYKDHFDSDMFWDWCRTMSKNNKVYISEYNAPDDFKCVWLKEVSSNFGATSKKATEKLFVRNETLL